MDEPQSGQSQTRFCTADCKPLLGDHRNPVEEKLLKIRVGNGQVQPARKVTWPVTARIALDLSCGNT